MTIRSLITIGILLGVTVYVAVGQESYGIQIRTTGSTIVARNTTNSIHRALESPFNVHFKDNELKGALEYIEGLLTAMRKSKGMRRIPSIAADPDDVEELAADTFDLERSSSRHVSTFPAAIFTTIEEHFAIEDDRAVAPEVLPVTKPSQSRDSALAD